MVTKSMSGALRDDRRDTTVPVKREQEFFHWSANIGWSLNVCLLGWVAYNLTKAITRRSASVVDKLMATLQHRVSKTEVRGKTNQQLHHARQMLANIRERLTTPEGLLKLPYVGTQNAHATIGFSTATEVLPRDTEWQQFCEVSVAPVAHSLACVSLLAFLSQRAVKVSRNWIAERPLQGVRQKMSEWKKDFDSALDGLYQSLMNGQVSDSHECIKKTTQLLEAWMKEPTTPLRYAEAELQAKWESWRPHAWGMSMMSPAGDMVPVFDGLLADPEGFSRVWWQSAVGVLQGCAESTLEAWAAATAAVQAAQPPQQVISTASAEPLAADVDGEAAPDAAVATGLVLRVFARWPRDLGTGHMSQDRNAPDEGWAVITNVPVTGTLWEHCLRLLLAMQVQASDAEQQGLAPQGAASHCQRLLGLVVAAQVSRVIKDSAWGALTTDLWRHRRAGGALELGYEAVEVPSREREEMIAAARAMPSGGSPGAVTPIDHIDVADGELEQRKSERSILRPIRT